MTILKKSIIAAITASGIGSAAAADNAANISGRDVGDNILRSNYECMATLSNPSNNSKICIESVESAIRSIAAYQLEVIQDPEKYGFVYEAVGNMNNETRVPVGELNQGAMGFLTAGIYQDIKDNLDLNADNMGAAIRNGDDALRKIFVMASQSSFGVHPKSREIVNILVGLDKVVQVQEANLSLNMD